MRHSRLKNGFLCTCALMISASLTTPTFAGVMDFSFSGTFSQDDEVQLFNFTVGTASNVTLKTLSYAGGINSAGTVIAAGGFDPILALFDAAGMLIDSNDDGSFPDVGIDPVTGNEFDTFLEATLTPGLYTVAVSQYYNFAVGPLLSDGFSEAGRGNFTGTDFGGGTLDGLPFIDAGGNQRTNAWAFEILNVDGATAAGGTVPEPTSLAIFGVLGIAGCISRRRRSRRRCSTSEKSENCSSAIS